MSNYRNFVTDFPRRCRDLLDLMEGAPKFCDWEVTLMLMVATSGIIIPYERLRSNVSHPADDRSSYPEAAKQFDDLLKQKFLKSELCNRPASAWSMGNLQSVAGYPDEWPELQCPQDFPPCVTVRTVINTMRNALAHGNTYTHEDVGGQIAALVFVCNETDPRRMSYGRYRFLRVSPGDFRVFLRNWFAFIDRLKISQSVALQILEEAA